MNNSYKVTQSKICILVCIVVDVECVEAVVKVVVEEQGYELFNAIAFIVVEGGLGARRLTPRVLIELGKVAASLGLILSFTADGSVVLSYSCVGIVVKLDTLDFLHAPQLIGDGIHAL